MKISTGYPQTYPQGLEKNIVWNVEIHFYQPSEHLGSTLEQSPQSRTQTEFWSGIKSMLSVTVRILKG
jgi:hypothetical protein